jgi:hypothetical protein
MIHSKIVIGKRVDRVGRSAAEMHSSTGKNSCVSVVDANINGRIHSQDI